MSSSTVILPIERIQRGDSRYFRYADGIATTKAEDDDIVLRLDWTDYLAASETVSSAAYEDSGVTRSSTSVSTPVTITTVTGLGSTTVTITTSNSRTAEIVVYFLPKGGVRAQDYR